MLNSSSVVVIDYEAFRTYCCPLHHHSRAARDKDQNVAMLFNFSRDKNHPVMNIGNLSRSILART